MWTKTWWLKVADRAIRAAAYTAITITGGDAANVLTTTTTGKLGMIAGSAILSILGSIATTKAYGDNDDPSLA